MYIRRCTSYKQTYIHAACIQTYINTYNSTDFRHRAVGVGGVIGKVYGCARGSKVKQGETPTIRITWTALM